MEFLGRLDTPTLAFVTGLAGFVLAAAMAGIRLAGMRNPALPYWGLAGLGFGLGHQLAHLVLALDFGAGRAAGLGLANSLITLTHVLLLAGIRVYLGRSSWLAPLLALAALLMVLGATWDAMAVLRTRMLVFSSAYVVLDLMSGAHLWRARSEGLTLFRRFAGGVFFFNALFLCARFAYAASTPSLTTSFAPDPFQILFYVVSLAFIYVLTVGLALLMFRGAEVELQRLVHRDPMTGLFNRRSLFDHAAREEARSERHGTPLSLVMLDIDHFKAVNDGHGHAAGDEVICQAAARISCSLRETDTAFRLGGEEFLILLPSTDLDAAIAIAERLRDSMSREPMAPMGRRITASLGVTQFARGREDWEAALRRTDAALYRAKHEGRDRVCAMAPPGARRIEAERVADLP